MGVDKIVPTYRLAMGTAGSARISHERIRQIEEEGFDLTHDMWRPVNLLNAAEAYMKYAREQQITGNFVQPKRAGLYGWPIDWDESMFKPSANPGRNLEKAGALIAAALDVVIRVTEQAEQATDEKLLASRFGKAYVRGDNGDQPQQPK